MYRLLFKLSILFFFVTLICLGVDAWYRRLNNYPYVYPKHVFLDPEISEKYQIVTVGNSHAQAGITFAQYQLRSLNLASVAQRFSLDLALLKQRSRQIEKGAVILIPVTPISFAHRPLDTSDSLQKNYYDSVSPFLIPHLNIGSYLQTQVFPFVQSGSRLRTQYADKVQERIRVENQRPVPVVEQGSEAPSPAKVSAQHPPQTQEIILAEPDFSLIDGGVYTDNIDFLYAKWYNTPEFSPQYFAENRRDLEAMITFSLQKGWRPVLITIPIADAVRDKMRDDFMETYLYENLRKTETSGIPYFDFSGITRLSGDLSYYANGDHLNARGASLFSYLLLHKLIDSQILPASADGYVYTKRIQK